MSPVDAFSQLLKVNPSLGRFLMAGLGVMAAGAIAVGFGGFGADALLATVYVLGFAVAATLLYFVLDDQLMRRVLSWALVVTFLLWLVGLVVSALPIAHGLPSTTCYVRLLWQHPLTCEMRLAPVVAEVGGDQQTWLPTGGPERVWLAQEVDPPVPLTPPESAGLVFLQFGPGLDRGTSTRIAEELEEYGWDVPGADTGGEFVWSSPDRNEVRFFHPSDSASAMALAEAAHAANPQAPVVIRDFSRLGGYVPEGQLELWLNVVPAAP